MLLEENYKDVPNKIQKKSTNFLQLFKIEMANTRDKNR